jgi:hypothetical protein
MKKEIYICSTSGRWNRLLLVGIIAVGAVCALVAATDPYAAVVLRPGQRELFLDDYILGDLYRTTRVIHQPVKFAGNPVIRPDLPTDGQIIQTRSGPYWDEHEKIWKMWYIRYGHDGNGAGNAGYAHSKDGIHWEKPMLGLVEVNGNKQNNLVMVQGDPNAFIQHVLLDPKAPPDRRYKGLIGPHGRKPIVSADGLVFKPLDVPPIPSEDESHLSWDDRGGRYVLTVKHSGPFGRSVYLSLSKDFEHWSDPELIYSADAQDQALGEQYIREVEANPQMWRPTVNEPREYNTDIYNMAVFPYEGIYIGLPNYFESSGRILLARGGNEDGINSPKLACSRNLITWTKVGDRAHFIPVSAQAPGVWDTGQIFPTSHPILMGDELWFYYSGIDVRHRPNVARTVDEYHGAIYLAKLRVDGFVSLRSGEEGGFVDTRTVVLEGKHLYINATAGAGQIRAEITERNGRVVVPGWGLEQCVPVEGDHVRVELRWPGRDLAELRGKNVRIRFHLKNADLYSFWLEP